MADQVITVACSEGFCVNKELTDRNVPKRACPLPSTNLPEGRDAAATKELKNHHLHWFLGSGFLEQCMDVLVLQKKKQHNYADR